MLLIADRVTDLTDRKLTDQKKRFAAVNAQLAQVIVESAAHLVLEYLAEIIRGEADLPRCILQRDSFAEMLLHIVDGIVEHILALYVCNTSPA